jgi:hypothetical protein
MKKYLDKDTGFTIKTTNKKLIIEMPLSNLIRGFESSPDNYFDEKTPQCKVNRKEKYDFLNWIALNLQDECDANTGQNFMDKMLSDLFIRVYEGYEDFVTYKSEENE